MRTYFVRYVPYGKSGFEADGTIKALVVIPSTGLLLILSGELYTYLSTLLKIWWSIGKGEYIVPLSLGLIKIADTIAWFSEDTSFRD